MALVVKDRIKETTSTTGTGTLTLAGAVTKFQSFSAVGDGNTTYYAIESGNGTDWEIGVGTYTASGTTLSRDTILESSNAGSAINLSGTSTVFCTYPAERSVNTAGATFTGTVNATRVGVSASTASLDLISTSNIFSRINFGDAADTDIGQIYYDHPNNAMKFYTNNVERMGISSAGVVDIGGNVVLDASDIGSTVQAYDADTAKYDDTTANFTGTLQNGGSNVVVDSDIGSTVQGYDANTAKYNDITANFTGTLQQGGSNVLTGNQTITLSGDATGSGTTAITVTVVDDSHNHIISNVDGLQTALDGKADLSGANFTGNVYSTGNIGLDSTDYISWTDNTQMDIYVNGSNEFRFEADGDFHADGDVIAYSTTTASDEKLKDDIKVVDNALDKVCALRGVTFTWKRDNQESAGVIAQDVQKVLPEAVKEIKNMQGNTHLTVNYPALTSILIESIKELKEEINKLKGN